VTRRRRRERARHGEHARTHQPAERRRAKDVPKRREALELRLGRLRRLRTGVGALGFVPLVASLLCTSGWVALFCAVPREIYLGLWAVIFGTFLGLTVRMWRERRAFAREAAS
jgi:hypothetical protein